MILACGHCGALYDAASLKPGAALACACGDLLLVPDLDSMEGDAMIQSYVKRLAVEEGLNLDASAGTSRWELRRGGANLSIQYDAEEETLAVESEVMPLPEDPVQRAALFRKVLELNLRATAEARFALSGEKLLVTFTRSIAGMDYVEFHTALSSVARCADEYDDVLKAEFLPARAPSAGEEDDGEVDLSSLEV